MHPAARQGDNDRDSDVVRVDGDGSGNSNSSGRGSGRGSGSHSGNGLGVVGNGDSSGDSGDSGDRLDSTNDKLDAAVERFARNGALIAGGARAILLQVADPVVGAGVAQHSDFAHRPLDRLRNTLTFVYAVVLGTPDEAARVAGYVDRAHRGIPGATDPEHQLWVAATLYDSAILVHEKIYGPLDNALADRILARYAPLATSLQVPLADWPSSRAAFDPWFADVTARLEVSNEARGVARDLFHPVVAPPWLRAGLPLVSLLTASLLGERLRDTFELPWSAARERRANAAWAVARVAVRLAPRRLWEWPSRHYLDRLRARRPGNS